MKKETIVRVTAEDFEWAERRHSGGCAIARAVKRAIPEAKTVSVDIQTIRATVDGERLAWLTNWRAQDAIIAYDAGEEHGLKPIEFRLRRSEAQRIRRRKVAADGSKHVVAKGRKSVPRSAPSAGERGNRIYGRRALTINVYRERNGELPARDS